MVPNVILRPNPTDGIPYIISVPSVMYVYAYQNCPCRWMQHTLMSISAANWGTDFVN